MKFNKFYLKINSNNNSNKYKQNNNSLNLYNKIALILAFRDNKINLL